MGADNSKQEEYEKQIHLIKGAIVQTEAHLACLDDRLRLELSTDTEEYEQISEEYSFLQTYLGSLKKRKHDLEILKLSTKIASSIGEKNQDMQHEFRHTIDFIDTNLGVPRRRKGTAVVKNNSKETKPPPPPPASATFLPPAPTAEINLEKNIEERMKALMSL